ncbi:hypothetical protein EES43_08150 [Streptomyces sp. ADI96-02]|nr:hypothetical protein EES43_08150 [Streptomyces sp. ADI96-02]
MAAERHQEGVGRGGPGDAAARVPVLDDPYAEFGRHPVAGTAGNDVPDAVEHLAGEGRQALLGPQLSALSPGECAQARNAEQEGEDDRRQGDGRRRRGQGGQADEGHQQRDAQLPGGAQKRRDQ